jgi:hypothetical protein
MIKQNYLRDNLQRIGQLVGLGKDETIAAIKTRRQILLATAIMIISALTFNFYNGTIPLKYTGISINDFSWFWGMR